MEEPVENTSSDPISETTPVVPGAVPDTDFVSDADHAALALESMKRDGSVMFEVGGTPGTPLPLPRDTMAMMDVDGARVPVDGIDDPDLRDPSGKKQKTGDAITDLAEVVADKTVAKVMKQMQADNSRLDESLELAVNEAVSKLSGDLQRDLKNWEAKMDDKVKAQLLNHQSGFEKKWESKIVQLEPSSRDGVISSAEFRIRNNVEEAVDKNWKDRMEKEDKIMINRVETLHSIVDRLEQEVTTLKGKHSISAASTVATSSGNGGSHIGQCTPGVASELLPTRIELKGWGVWRKIRETGITVDQGRGLVGQVKALTPVNHHEKFDWEMTDKDQGYFDLKMMVFLWFKDGVTLRDRRMALMDTHQALQRTPVEVRGAKVRATLEIDPSKYYEKTCKP